MESLCRLFALCSRCVSDKLTDLRTDEAEDWETSLMISLVTRLESLSSHFSCVYTALSFRGHIRARSRRLAPYYITCYVRHAACVMRQRVGDTLVVVISHQACRNRDLVSYVSARSIPLHHSPLRYPRTPLPLPPPPSSPRHHDATARSRALASSIRPPPSPPPSPPPGPRPPYLVAES